MIPFDGTQNENCIRKNDQGVIPVTEQKDIQRVMCTELSTLVKSTPNSDRGLFTQ